jgi:hypothetical protein
MKANSIFVSLRHGIVLLLLASSRWEWRARGQAVLHDASGEELEARADDAEHDAEGFPKAVNDTAYSSRKCRRYSYDEGYASLYDRDVFGQVNDLTSSCKSRASNMHGTYTSKGLCFFAFHKIIDDKVPLNRMSVACSDANLVEESRAVKDDPVVQRVSKWPDTCVGDFPRCYRLEHDEQVLLKFICSLKLEVPQGATHLSVDCTADKAELKNLLKNGKLELDPHMKSYADHQKRERREYYAFVVALSVAGCACCFICLLMVHRYAFKPYIKALKRTRSDPELAGLTSPDASRS